MIDARIPLATGGRASNNYLESTMYAATLYVEANAYLGLNKHTQFSFEVSELGDRMAQRELAAGYADEEVIDSILDRVDAGEMVILYSTGGAANVRISTQGWLMLSNDLSKLAGFRFSIDGLFELERDEPVTGLTVENGILD